MRGRLGVEAVILSPRCADPLYRRSVKVSMGAVFAVPYARMTDWHRRARRAARRRLPAARPHPGAVRGARRQGAAGRPGARSCWASEGDGLSSRWLRAADEAVCIPMSRDAMALGVDSLNVVAAAAIACHSLMR